MVIVAGTSDRRAASGKECEAPLLPNNWDLEKFVQDLIEAALGQRDDSSEVGGLGPAAAGVLLDVEYRHVRCILLHQPGPTAAAVLSPRELEIARMAAIGYPNKTIASTLEISLWTVSSHLRRVFEKLGVSSRAAMATRLATEAQPTSRPEDPRCSAHSANRPIDTPVSSRGARSSRSGEKAAPRGGTA